MDREETMEDDRLTWNGDVNQVGERRRFIDDRYNMRMEYQLNDDGDSALQGMMGRTEGYGEERGTHTHDMYSECNEDINSERLENEEAEEERYEVFN